MSHIKLTSLDGSALYIPAEHLIIYIFNEDKEHQRTLIINTKNPDHRVYVKESPCEIHRLLYGK